MSDALLGIAVTAAAVILYVALDSLTIFSFVIDQTGVRSRFLGIPMGSVRLDEITDVEVGSVWDLFWDGTLLRSSRIGVHTFKKNVVIFRKNGQPLVLGPRDPVEFQQTLLSRLALGRGQDSEAGRLTSA
jgi:hypothetical protein